MENNEKHSVGQEKQVVNCQGATLRSKAEVPTKSQLGVSKLRFRTTNTHFEPKLKLESPN